MPRTVLYVWVWLLGLGVVVGGCSSAESTRPGATLSPPSVPEPERIGPTDVAGPPSGVVSRLIQEALRSDGRLSRQSLVERLGAPRRIETEPIPNQYVRDQVDTLRTLIYTGIRALVYDVTDDPKNFLVRLSLSSSQYTTPEGLHVGISEQRLIETLGPPTRQDEKSGELIYQEDGPNPTSMVVRVREGRVVQIGWEFAFT